MVTCHILIGKTSNPNTRTVILPKIIKGQVKSKAGCSTHVLIREEVVFHFVEIFLGGQFWVLIGPIQALDEGVIVWIVEKYDHSSVATVPCVFRNNNSVILLKKEEAFNIDPFPMPLPNTPLIAVGRGGSEQSRNKWKWSHDQELTQATNLSAVHFCTRSPTNTIMAPSFGVAGRYSPLGAFTYTQTVRRQGHKLTNRTIM